MKLDYDKVADAAYISLDKGKIIKTIEMDSGIVVDVGEKGKIIGIEIIWATIQKINHVKLADLVCA